jgi:transposase-like protein
MDDLSRFCCLNPACPDHGKRGCGNLTVRARYGKHKRRLLYCKRCKARFSKRKGTPLFDCRLGDDKAAAVLAHLNDGCGVRQTERLTKVNRNTVMRLARLAGGHARAAIPLAAALALTAAAGVSAASSLTEEDALLGAATDKEIAAQIGWSWQTVGQHRRRLGIPSVGKRGRGESA